MKEKLFEARLSDLLTMAENGIPVCTDFMNPEEQYRSETYLKTNLGPLSHTWDGGFPGAERKRLCLFPEYFSPEDGAAFADSCTGALLVTGSGYEALDHRAFLGAILALGLKRETLGDIVVKNNSAVVIADTAIVDFLTGTEHPLTSVGRDRGIRVSRFEIPEDFDPGRRYAEIHDVIASPRLDCVTASLAGLSRERAKATVRSGAVFRNYTEATSPDTEVCEGDILTIRGTGKFRIECISEKTRKERYRLFAKKYL